jgi:hypothetical protein
MNIFYLDQDPEVAATYLVDKHVNKMGLESAQMLSTAHRVLDGKEDTIIKNGRRKKVWVLPDDRETKLYSSTHVNHPSNIWVRESDANYKWLLFHTKAIFEIFAKRGKIHKTSSLLCTLNQLPDSIPSSSFTSLPLCMPEKFKMASPVDSYREFYRRGKAHLHTWTHNATPSWL